MTSPELSSEFVQTLRDQFPSLARTMHGAPIAYLDGAAGTQVPQRVIDAISHYLAHNNANTGGLFATSSESDALLDDTHQAVADFLGANDPDCVSFGPNMTTLTFALSRALARTWQPGDEIVVTLLDHDANVTPWLFAAQDAGATVRYARIHRADATLDLADLQSKINERTRLVAVGAASNASGSVQPLRQIADWAHQVNALLFVDAVHLAPHRLIDVDKWQCDLLACSAYKFFGPHIGVQWGRRDLLEELVAYKVRPCAEELPHKWMTGTQNHECLAGVAAAIDYLAEIGQRLNASDASDNRRTALRTAFAAIDSYERSLASRLINGLMSIDGVTIHGITDARLMDQRLPTVSFTHTAHPPDRIARELGKAGIFVWHGNFYALSLSEALGLEPTGMVRVSMVHYNTPNEVDRLVSSLANTCRS